MRNPSDEALRAQGEAARQFGKFAEDRAAEFYVKRGYAIRDRRWRPKDARGPSLEVDLIAQSGRTVAFVEVKARGANSPDPLDAIDAAKIRKLVRAADIYLSRMSEDVEYRFDIVGVTGSEEDYEIEVVEDAFMPPLGRL